MPKTTTAMHRSCSTFSFAPNAAELTTVLVKSCTGIMPRVLLLLSCLLE